MQETQLVPTFPNQPVRLVTRDFVAIGFRHRRVLVCTFLAVMACAL